MKGATRDARCRNHDADHQGGPPERARERRGTRGASRSRGPVRRSAGSHVRVSASALRHAWAIVVNADHASTRQRCTLALELGHFVWHRTILGAGTNDTRKYRADPRYRFHNDAIERGHESEANQFATSLLMPSDMVRHVHRDAGVDAPELLAVIFGVSPRAMAIRVDNLTKRDML